MTANELAERLAQQAETVARMLLPDGKRDGAEWRCGSVQGEAGDSLGVHLTGGKAGVWRDFSADVGGDLIGLWMAVRGLALREACSEAMEFLGIAEDRPTHVARSYRKPAKDGVHRLTPEHAAWLRDVRKIPDATVEAYRLASRGERLMFPYLRDGELVFAKYRKLPKQFSAEADCEPILFGWQVVKPDSRAAILAEGELDAMAWHAYGYPALSVPTGAGGLAWVEGEFLALEPYDTLYLSMDMDEAGQRSIAALAERLGRERCKVVRLPKKDANDCLIQGVPRDDMTRALRDARTLDPTELRNIGEFEDAIVAEMTRVDEGLRLPWKKTHDRLRLRPGELSVWAGINGHGKSQIASQIVAYQASHDVRCCVASMEWRTARWALRMQRQIGAVESLTESYSRSLTHALSSTLWTFNVAGSAKAQRILDVFRYARRRYGIELFLLDNLTKCGFADDDYSGQKRFVEQLADFTRESDCHVMLIAHMRKGESEDKPPGKFDVKGSGGITDMAPTVVGVWRNKAREHAIEFAEAAAQRGAKFELPDEFADGGKRAMDARLIVYKQNETGDEPVFNLWFNRATGQFLAQPHHTPRAMFPLIGIANTGGNAA
jgi:twinkle protein